MLAVRFAAKIRHGNYFRNAFKFSISVRHFHASDPKMAKQDPYSVLGIPKAATQSDIKKAYFALAKKYHPDTFANATETEKQEAKKRFVEIQEAYEFLGDEQKRAQYDKFGFGFGGAGEEGWPGGGYSKSAGGSQEFAEDILRNFFRQGGGNPFSDFGFGGSSSGGFTAEDIFGRGSFSGQPRRAPRDDTGGNIMANLTISFMEAIRGVSRKSIAYSALSRCNSCSGSGLKGGAKPKTCKSCGGSGEQMLNRSGFRILMECQSCGGSGISVSPDSICGSCKGDGRVKEKREIQIDIPPGVDTGERLRVTGRGNASREANGISGDLFVHINVASPSLQESRFKRQGADISVETNIPFYQAILGGPAQVPTLDGYVTLKVQPGMQSDTRIVMPGYGIQKLSQPPGVKGNQTVIFKVLTPSVKELTEEQRKLLEEFRRISEQNENRKAGESKGFLRKTLYRLKDSLNCDDNIDKKPDQGGR